MTHCRFRYVSRNEATPVIWFDRFINNEVILIVAPKKLLPLRIQRLQQCLGHRVLFDESKARLLQRINEHLARLRMSEIDRLHLHYGILESA